MSIYRDFLDEILSIAKWAKVDVGVAQSVWFNAIKHGKIPDGEAPEIKVVMERLFADWDFAEFKTAYEAMTAEELDADAAAFNAAVLEHYKTKSEV